MFCKMVFLSLGIFFTSTLWSAAAESDEFLEDPRHPITVYLKRDPKNENKKLLDEVSGKTFLNITIAGYSEENVIESVFQFLLPNNHLQCLSLAGCALRDSDVSNIMTGAFRLKTLNLQSNKITERGLAFIGVFLKHGYRLEALDLSWNSIGRDPTLLFEALGVNKKLRELVLKRIGLHSSQGWQLLMQALETNKTLKTLVLDGNECRVEKDYFEKALTENTTLEALSLADSGLRTQYIVTLMNILDKVPKSPLRIDIGKISGARKIIAAKENRERMQQFSPVSDSPSESPQLMRRHYRGSPEKGSSLGKIPFDGSGAPVLIKSTPGSRQPSPPPAALSSPTAPPPFGKIGRARKPANYYAPPSDTEASEAEDPQGWV